MSQKPVVLRNENDYQWARSLDLNGTTLWSSSLDEMQKLVFGPERVIISKIDLRDPLYLKEDDNFSYHVRDDGILTIEYENKEENENKESKHFNILSFPSSTTYQNFSMQNLRMTLVAPCTQSPPNTFTISY